MRNKRAVSIVMVSDYVSLRRWHIVRLMSTLIRSSFATSLRLLSDQTTPSMRLRSCMWNMSTFYEESDDGVLVSLSRPIPSDLRMTHALVSSNPSEQPRETSHTTLIRIFVDFEIAWVLEISFFWQFAWLFTSIFTGNNIFLTDLPQNFLHRM